MFHGRIKIIYELVTQRPNTVFIGRFFSIVLPKSCSHGWLSATIKIHVYSSLKLFADLLVSLFDDSRVDTSWKRVKY